MLPGFVLLVPYRPQISRQLFPRLDHSLMVGSIFQEMSTEVGFVPGGTRISRPTTTRSRDRLNGSLKRLVSACRRQALRRRNLLLQLHQRVGWVGDEYSLPSRRPKCSSRGFFVLRRTVLQHTRFHCYLAFVVISFQCVSKPSVRPGFVSTLSD